MSAFSSAQMTAEERGRLGARRELFDHVLSRDVYLSKDLLINMARRHGLEDHQYFGQCRCKTLAGTVTRGREPTDLERATTNVRFSFKVMV